MRLMYSPVNQHFLFLFGDAPTRLEGEKNFFPSKAAAIEAARRKGLKVDSKGFVSAMNPSNMNGLADAPPAPHSGFGKERTPEDYQTRISWETWAARNARRRGEEAIAQGHDLAREAYKREFGKKFPGMNGLEEIRPGQMFVIIDKRTSQAVSDIFQGSAKADAALERMDDNENYQVMDALWHNPSRAKLKASGLIGELGRGGFDGVSRGTRQGTRVRFSPNPVSHALYRNPPTVGEEGAVTTMPGGGRRTFLPGPGGGLLYVKWDEHGTMGVSPIDLEKVGGGDPEGLEGGGTKSDKLRSLDEFTRQYIETALWSSNDESTESGGKPLDANYGLSDLTVATLDGMIKDCAKFQRDNAELLAQAGDDGQNGHDFWLTRNGHGAGFWDRGYGEVGEKLTKAAKAYREVYLSVSGGEIHSD